MLFVPTVADRHDTGRQVTTDDRLLLADLDRIASVITEGIEVLDDDRKRRPDEAMLLVYLMRAGREIATLRERLERRLMV